MEKTAKPLVRHDPQVCTCWSWLSRVLIEPFARHWSHLATRQQVRPEQRKACQWPVATWALFWTGEAHWRQNDCPRYWWRITFKDNSRRWRWSRARHGSHPQCRGIPWTDGAFPQRKDRRLSQETLSVNRGGIRSFGRTSEVVHAGRGPHGGCLRLRSIWVKAKRICGEKIHHEKYIATDPRLYASVAAHEPNHSLTNLVNSSQWTSIWPALKDTTGTPPPWARKLRDSESPDREITRRNRWEPRLRRALLFPRTQGRLQWKKIALGILPSFNSLSVRPPYNPAGSYPPIFGLGISLELKLFPTRAPKWQTRRQTWPKTLSNWFKTGCSPFVNSTSKPPRPPIWAHIIEPWWRCIKLTVSFQQEGNLSKRQTWADQRGSDETDVFFQRRVPAKDVSQRLGRVQQIENGPFSPHHDILQWGWENSQG